MIVLSLNQPGMSCVFQFGPWCIARTMFLIILYIFEIQNKTNPVFFFFLTLFFLTPNDFFWLLFFPLCVCVYFHPSPPKKNIWLLPLLLRFIFFPIFLSVCKMGRRSYDGLFLFFNDFYRLPRYIVYMVSIQLACKLPRASRKPFSFCYSAWENWIAFQ
jgi:hypothetical protein